MPEDIEEILKAVQQIQDDPDMESSIQQELINQLLNPIELNSSRLRIVEEPENGVVSESREGVIINAEGYPEKIKEETINVMMLGDGTSLNPQGIVRCQTCSRLIKEASLSRCLCGKTVCIMCARHNGKYDIWFCGRIHKFLWRLYRIFGIDFR